MKQKKYPTSMRLSEKDKGLLKALVRHLEVSESDVIRLALRALAKQEGLRVNEDTVSE